MTSSKETWAKPETHQLKYLVVRVVLLLDQNGETKVVMAQRPTEAGQGGGQWQLLGGKVEIDKMKKEMLDEIFDGSGTGEKKFDQIALAEIRRELAEEIDLKPEEIVELTQSHGYFSENKAVCTVVFVAKCARMPKLREQAVGDAKPQQAIKDLSRIEVGSAQYPAAFGYDQDIFYVLHQLGLLLTQT